jgi:hypothetical protein
MPGVDRSDDPTQIVLFFQENSLLYTPSGLSFLEAAWRSLLFLLTFRVFRVQFLG